MAAQYVETPPRASIGLPAYSYTPKIRAKLSPIPRIPQLDGIRGLAILLVIVHHYIFGTFNSPPPSTPLDYLSLPLHLGWTGVDLFFVLSGFLIAGILLENRHSPNLYPVFYARRALRIVPLYFLALVLFPLVQTANSPIPLWSYPLFLQNIYAAHTQTFPPTWLTPTWSLAVEEQFYLLLPLAIRNLRTRSLLALTLAAILAAPLFRLAYHFSGNPFFGPYTMLPCRADSLGVGVLLALALRHAPTRAWLQARRKLYLPVLTVLGLIVLYTTRNRFGIKINAIGYTAVALFYGVLLLWVLLQPQRLFTTRPLLWLGTHAYGLYLFHCAVNHLLHTHLLAAEPAVMTPPAIAVTLLAFVLILPIAALTWNRLERPLIHYGHRKFKYHP